MFGMGADVLSWRWLLRRCAERIRGGQHEEALRIEPLFRDHISHLLLCGHRTRVFRDQWHFSISAGTPDFGRLRRNHDHSLGVIGHSDFVEIGRAERQNFKLRHYPRRRDIIEIRWRDSFGRRGDGAAARRQNGAVRGDWWEKMRGRIVFLWANGIGWSALAVQNLIRYFFYGWGADWTVISFGLIPFVGLVVAIGSLRLLRVHWNDAVLVVATASTVILILYAAIANAPMYE
jgi:hypothetical protein